MKYIHLLLTFLIGTAIWFSPCPEGLKHQAWHLFGIFVASIYAIITKPYPMGVITFLSLATVILTKTVSLNNAFSGFSHPVVWLIVLAFFIARAFIQTGLGKRISYIFMALLGKSTLGLGYGMVISDFLLAPAIPSITARAGGVIYPIMNSISISCGSLPKTPSASKIGSFLTKVTMQSTCITSAMFLTAMSANPLICTFANEIFANRQANDIAIPPDEITWTNWAIAAIVPGIVCLVLMPLIIYKLYPPEIKETKAASEKAREELKKLGKLSRNEKIMVGVFVLLIALWSLGTQLGIDATLAGLIGLGVLLLTNVLSWDDIKEEKGAWETLVWFGILYMLASQLNSLGMTTWFSTLVTNHLPSSNWMVGFGILSLVYFYTHYFFASNFAHVTALYSCFLAVAITLGTPPMVAALVLGFFSNLFSGLTHYSSGPAAILFEAGYVDIREWWKSGFIMSVINIAIFLSVGSLWWYFLGHFGLPI